MSAGVQPCAKARWAIAPSPLREVWIQTMIRDSRAADLACRAWAHLLLSARRSVATLLASRFVGQVGTTLFAQLVVLVLALGQAAIVARWLGPEGKGVLALAQLLPGTLAIFLNFGINTANVYHVGSRRLDVAKLASNSMMFALIGSAIGIGAIAASAAGGWLGLLMPGVPIPLLLLAMASLPAFFIVGYSNSILQGLQRISTVNAVNIAQALLVLVLMGLLIVALGTGLLGAVVAFVAGGLVTSALVGWLLYRQGGALIPRWSWPTVRVVLPFGLRGYAGQLLQFFNYRLDMFLVNFFLDPASVGIYSVSVRMAELLWYLPNAVGFVMFPRAASAKPAEMRSLTPRVLWATLALTTAGAVGLAILGRLLIVVIYSPAFLGAYAPLLALLPGVVLLGGAKVLTNVIAGRGYPQYNSVNAGVSFLLTVVFDLLLIPAHGVLGASIASSVSYASTFIIAIGFYLALGRRADSAAQTEAGFGEGRQGS